MLGNLGERGWGSFWENEPEGGVSGHLFGMVTTVGENGSQIGRRLIEEINNKILVEQRWEVSGGFGENSKWVAMVISEDRVRVSGEGFRVYLVRGEKMALIFAGGKSVAGKVNGKDRFLFVSEKLKERLTEEILDQILAEKTVDGLAEKMKEQILVMENQEGLAGALIEVGEENLMTEEKPVVFKPKWKINNLKIPRIRMGWLWKENGVSNRWNLWFSVIVLLLLAAGIVFGYQRKKVTEKPVIPKAVGTIEEKTKETNNLAYEFIYNTELTGNEGKNYENIVVLGDKAYITDRGSGRIDRIDWKLKSAEKILVDDKIKGISEITLGNNEVLAFDGQSVWGIKKEGMTELGKVNTLNLIKLRVWNGGWYFLANDGGIWKKNSGAEVKQWTLEEKELVSNANDIAIDGKVWVSNASGELKRYQTGKLDNWKTLVKPAELDFVRVLVRAEGSQVVLVSRKMLWAFDKEKGTQLGTFNLEKVGIKDAAMTDDGGSVIILGADQNIYKVKLSGEVLQ
jgi:hypothetical protein